jgi:Tfp pilus assembly protein PilX
MTLMAMMLLTALGTALTLATITETAIAANYRDAAAALYAAEGAVEFVMQELADVPDWSDVISESGR